MLIYVKNAENWKILKKAVDFMYFIFIIVIEDLNSNLFQLCF